VTPGDLDIAYPQYHCPLCGEELPLVDARLTITCAEHLADEREVSYEIRPAKDSDLSAIEDICDRALGETDVDVFGGSFDVLSGENLLAVADGRLLGLCSTAVHGGDLAIVLLSVYPESQGLGVGRALVEAAAVAAGQRALPLVKAAVTNDDIPSLYFYLRLGFVVDDIAIGAVADSLGGASPGFSGIPIRDEIRLKRPACVADA
jgi:ribosomal protein S18 acetylase RimI-like enzyme